MATRSPGSVSAASVSASPETPSHSSPNVRTVFVSLIAMRPGLAPDHALELLDDRPLQILVAKARKGPSRGPVPIQGTRIVLEPPSGRKRVESGGRRVGVRIPLQGMQALGCREPYALRRRLSTTCSRWPSTTAGFATVPRGHGVRSSTLCLAGLAYSGAGLDISGIQPCLICDAPARHGKYPTITH